MRATVSSIFRVGNDRYIMVLLRDPESVALGISRKESRPRARIKRADTPADMNAWRTQLQLSCTCYYNRSRTGLVLISSENIISVSNSVDHSVPKSEINMPANGLKKYVEGGRGLLSLSDPAWGFEGICHWTRSKFWDRSTRDLLRKYNSRSKWELHWCKGWGLNRPSNSTIK